MEDLRRAGRFATWGGVAAFLVQGLVLFGVPLDGAQQSWLTYGLGVLIALAANILEGRGYIKALFYPNGEKP